MTRDSRRLRRYIGRYIVLPKIYRPIYRYIRNGGATPCTAATSITCANASRRPDGAADGGPSAPVATSSAAGGGADPAAAGAAAPSAAGGPACSSRATSNT